MEIRFEATSKREGMTLDEISRIVDYARQHHADMSRSVRVLSTARGKIKTLTVTLDAREVTS